MNNNLKKNAANIKEIQFVALESNAPLFTATGPNVQFFLENSELIQNILELSKDRPNKSVLVVPIGELPAARRILLIHILSGKPIGRGTEFYPLVEEAERDIQNAVNAKLREINGEYSESYVYYLTQDERYQAILETMRYLLIPDELIPQMLVFDEDAREEFSVDEEIENLVDTYKKYLFLTGRIDLLSEKDRAALQEYYDRKREYFIQEKKRLKDLQKADFDKFQKQLRRPASIYRNNDYNEPPDRYEEQLEDLRDEEREVFDPSLHRPVGMKGYGKVKMLKPLEYETFLRTVYYRRRRPGTLAGELHLNTLFNENERAKKTSFLNKNNSAVFFYNPNQPSRNTRKNKGNKGKNKNLKSNTNNGSAWGGTRRGRRT